MLPDVSMPATTFQQLTIDSRNLRLEIKILCKWFCFRGSLLIEKLPMERFLLPPFLCNFILLPA